MNISHYIPSKIKNTKKIFDCSRLLKTEEDSKYLDTYEFNNDFNTGFKIIPRCYYHYVEIVDPKGFIFKISMKNYFDLIANVDITNNEILTPVKYIIDRDPKVDLVLSLIWEDNKHYETILAESLNLEKQEFATLNFIKMKPALVRGRANRSVYLGRYYNLKRGKKMYCFCYGIESTYFSDMIGKSKKYDLIDRELSDEELQPVLSRTIHKSPDYCEVEEVIKTKVEGTLENVVRDNYGKYIMVVFNDKTYVCKAGWSTLNLIEYDPDVDTVLPTLISKPVSTTVSDKFNGEMYLLKFKLTSGQIIDYYG